MNSKVKKKLNIPYVFRPELDFESQIFIFDLRLLDPTVCGPSVLLSQDRRRAVKTPGGPPQDLPQGSGPPRLPSECHMVADRYEGQGLDSFAPDGRSTAHIIC